MASYEPGLAPIAAAAEDPIKDALQVIPCLLHWQQGNFSIQFWTYGLLYEEAGDSEILHFLGRDRTINSIVLLSNGISFAIQIVLFLLVGSIVAYAIGFGWLGVHTSEKWQAATGVHIVGLIAYQLTLTSWTAAFPGLARNTKELRVKAQQYEDGGITREEYDHADSMKRNELSNMAFMFTFSRAVEMVIPAIIVGIMFGLDVDASTANNNWGLSVLIASASGVWLLSSIPWFILEKRRPGMTVGPSGSIVVAGLRNLKYAIIQIWHLKQSLGYLVIYFLLGDSLNTTVTVISTLQNSVVSYNTLEITYLLLVGIAAQGVGIYAFSYPKNDSISTKTMFNAVAISIIILDIWGMIGIWTTSFGFHNRWEFWVHQVFYGLFICPCIVGKTSAFIGPLVSAASIDASPFENNSSPFYFLFALSLVSVLFVFFFVDLRKSQEEQVEYLIKEQEAKQKAV